MSVTHQSERRLPSAAGYRTREDVPEAAEHEHKGADKPERFVQDLPVN